MAPSVTQTVKNYDKASRQFRKEIQRDRQKAIAFLERIGMFPKQPPKQAGSSNPSNEPRH